MTSTAATPINAKKIDIDQFNQVAVRAKITAVEATRNRDGFLHTVMTPAKDEFSQPQSFRIRANTQLGRDGDMIEGLCELTGFVRQFEYPEKINGQTTGVMKQGKEDKLFLTWVRAL